MKIGCRGNGDPTSPLISEGDIRVRRADTATNPLPYANFNNGAVLAASRLGAASPLPDERKCPMSGPVPTYNTPRRLMSVRLHPLVVENLKEVAHRRRTTLTGLMEAFAVDCLTAEGLAAPDPRCADA
jgi:hypothetical protein